MSWFPKTVPDKRHTTSAHKYASGTPVDATTAAPGDMQGGNTIPALGIVARVRQLLLLDRPLPIPPGLLVFLSFQKRGEALDGMAQLRQELELPDNWQTLLLSLSGSPAESGSAGDDKKAVQVECQELETQLRRVVAALGQDPAQVVLVASGPAVRLALEWAMRSSRELAGLWLLATPACADAVPATPATRLFPVLLCSIPDASSAPDLSASTVVMGRDGYSQEEHSLPAEAMAGGAAPPVMAGHVSASASGVERWLLQQGLDLTAHVHAPCGEAGAPHSLCDMLLPWISQLDELEKTES